MGEDNKSGERKKVPALLTLRSSFERTESFFNPKYGRSTSGAERPDVLRMKASGRVLTSS